MALGETLQSAATWSIAFQNYRKPILVITRALFEILLTAAVGARTRGCCECDLGGACIPPPASLSSDLELLLE